MYVCVQPVSIEESSPGEKMELSAATSVNQRHEEKRDIRK